jgi:uncharacterized protein
MNDNGPVYLDTSALAKWYLNEARSEDVENYLQKTGVASISDLTVVEFRCLLARRRRAGELDLPLETRVFATFQEDLREGHLDRRAIPAGAFETAVNLIVLLLDEPLRTLDALHLAAARGLGASTIATADRVMIRAAEKLGFSVARFD